MTTTEIVLLPDAGPLIMLAYADALDLLFKPGWTVALVDMVLQEVTRSATPTRATQIRKSPPTGPSPTTAPPASRPACHTAATTRPRPPNPHPPASRKDCT